MEPNEKTELELAIEIFKRAAYNVGYFEVLARATITGELEEKTKEILKDVKKTCDLEEQYLKEVVERLGKE